MADISEQGNGENSDYFRTKAGVVIAALLHAAAPGDKPMIWLMRAVNGERRILEEAEEILDSSFEPDTQIALSDLRGRAGARRGGPVKHLLYHGQRLRRLLSARGARLDRERQLRPGRLRGGPAGGYNPGRFAMLWRQDVREELEGFRFEAQSVGVYDTVYLTPRRLARVSSHRLSPLSSLSCETPVSTSTASTGLRASAARRRSGRSMRWRASLR